MDNDQAQGVTTKPVHPPLKGFEALQEVGKVITPAEGKGYEDGASLDVRGGHNDFCCSFFTILDNVLTVGESADGKERAAWPHPCPGGLLEGAGWG